MEPGPGAGSKTFSIFSIFARKFQTMQKQDLVKLAKTPMPFGKYAGRMLIDLPEPYLLWFSNKGFPEGQLGKLLQLTLELKINGLEYLIEPLKKIPTVH